jgi:hypothetical protein
LIGKDLGAAPSAVSHRHQCLLAQHDRENLVGGGLLPGVDGVAEGRVAAIEVTGQGGCEPLMLVSQVWREPVAGLTRRRDSPAIPGFCAVTRIAGLAQANPWRDTV